MYWIYLEMVLQIQSNRNFEYNRELCRSKCNSYVVIDKLNIPICDQINYYKHLKSILQSIAIVGKACQCLEDVPAQSYI